MKRTLSILFFVIFVWPSASQEINIDGRLQPLLTEFFEICKNYEIEYHDKLFKLESIDIVNTLPATEHGTTLGMLRRDSNGEVVAIDINWMAQIDSEILKVIAFHEFAHYFLEYSKHICDDCGKVMAVVNTSYFEIVRDWDNQVRMLFEESPAFKRKYNSSIASGRYERP